MSIRKKVILSVNILVTMLVALVIGFTLPNNNTLTRSGDGKPNADVHDTITEDKPSKYIYEAGDVLIKQGGKMIDFSYDPSLDTAETTAKTVAYEYVFGNAMDVQAAVYLKSIDATGVNIAYAYSTTELDTTKTIEGETSYTTQTIAVGDTSVLYVYVLVTPTDLNVPVNFTTSVIWNYGKATTVNVNTNVKVEIQEGELVNDVPQTAVDNQLLEEPVAPTAPTGYYFDAWFLDANYTKPAEFPLSVYGQTLYARYHNLPLNSTEYMTYRGGSYTFTHTGAEAIDSVSNMAIIPTYYNDGANGKAPVTVIGDNAFSGLVNIDKIEFPYTITTIKTSACIPSIPATIDLSRCINLTTIESSAFASDNITNELDLRHCTQLTTIGNSAFKSIKVSVKLPSSVTSMGTGVFEDSAFASIDLSNLTNLTSLGDSAFKNNTTMSSVKLPKSLTSISADAFNNCTNLGNIVIPSLVQSIGNNAFYYSGIQTVNLNACTSMTSIGKDAFRGCTSLLGVTIPQGVTSIGTDAFNGCSELTYAVLPNGLTTLNNGTFSTCPKLANVVMPNSLMTMGNNVFRTCSSLKSITIPDSVTRIGQACFYQCSSLKSVVVPEGVTHIQIFTFSYCTELISATILGDVTEIADSSFAQCYALESVNIPDTVTRIGVSSFMQCRKLVNLDIGVNSQLTTIGKNAFYDCESLTSVIIGKDVATIDTTAFYACDNLKTVYDLSTSLELVAGSTEHGHVAANADNVYTSL